jgi:hypothetical protein
MSKHSLYSLGLDEQFAANYPRQMYERGVDEILVDTRKDLLKVVGNEKEGGS